jgi:protein-disulfide isomerase
MDFHRPGSYEMSQRKDDAAAARARAKAIVSAQKKKEKRNRILITVSVSAVAIIILGLISFFSFQDAKNTKIEASATGAQITPALADSNGSFYVSKDGKTNAPATDSTATRVDVFFDPQCPGCGVVDRGIGDRLAELVQTGEIDLYLSPVSFLDKASTDRYSSRAVNAVVTVAEKSPANLLKFVHAIYAKDFQPAEGGVSVSDEKLAALAVKTGVPEDVAGEFKNHSYFDWIAQNSQTQMSRTDYFSEGFSTPSIFLNSKVQNGVATDFTKVKFADSDVLKTFNDTYSNLPKGK